MAEVFPYLFYNMERKYSLGVSSLALLNHSDVIAYAFHFLPLLLDEFPLVNVDDIHLALL